MQSSQRYVLSPAARWSFQGRDLRLHTDSMVLVRNCPDSVKAWVEAISSNANGLPAPTDSDSVDIVGHLIRLGFAVEAFDRSWQDSAWVNQVEYFAALGLDAGSAQRRLQSMPVTVLGVGGIGAAVLSELVGAGVSSLTLVDQDEVALRNLNRQYLYRRCDIGRPKVDVARDWVLDRIPEADVRTAIASITSPIDLRPWVHPEGYLVVAADTPGDLPQICAQVCRDVSATMILGGCGLKVGASGPVVTPPHLDSFVASRQAAQSIAMTAAAPMTASFGPANTIVGATMGRDLVLSIAGVEAGVDERRIDLV